MVLQSSQPVTGDRPQPSFVFPSSCPPSSISTSGVGLPASGEALHPNQVSTLHPHTPPDEQVAHHSGECYNLDSFRSFTTETCLELLRDNVLTTDQVLREINYQNSLKGEPELSIKTRGAAKKMGDLAKSLATCIEHCASHTDDSLITSDDTLTNTQLHFSYLADQAQKCVDEMRAFYSATSRSPVTQPQQPTPTVSEFSDSVCTILDDIDFQDLTVEGVLQQLPLSDFGRGSCGRRTRYFGARSYSYEATKHEPLPYPSCPLFDTIFARMQRHDSDFTTSKVTCLVTYYADGGSFIRPHSDNEREVVPDSSIYTISIGAARKLRLTSRDDVLRQHDFDLAHGSVSTMSSTSQHSWEHEIVRDPTVDKPRISFTFRYLMDPVPNTPAPPIEQPSEARPVCAGDKHRVLLLTDSIAKSTPEHLFDRIPGHRCIKKVNYYLTDVLNFEPEFRYTDVVIVSCGINDLSTRQGARPPLRAHTLADLFTRKLSDCCDRNPDTQFIFNSLLHTKHDWLNAEVCRFNNIMFQLSLATPNLRFLDTHQALMVSDMCRTRTVLERSDPRGTHLTLEAKKLVTRQLVNAVELTVGRRTGTITGSTVRGWSWPLRREFVSIFRQVSAMYVNR